MSNLSSFISSTNQNNTFLKHILSNGSGTLTTFSNSGSGFIYGIDMYINPSFGSGVGYNTEVTFNTAISNQSNTTQTIRVLWDGTTTNDQRLSTQSTNGLLGIPNKFAAQSINVLRLTGMFIPINSRFSGTTTISLSGTNVGSILVANLYYR